VELVAAPLWAQVRNNFGRSSHVYITRAAHKLIESPAPKKKKTHAVKVVQWTRYIFANLCSFCFFFLFSIMNSHECVFSVSIMNSKGDVLGPSAYGPLKLIS
jgi:hypothetical protein